MSYNFWTGSKVRLRAIEQKDFDAIMASNEEPDTELDRYEDQIHFPISREKNRDRLQALATRERTDDTYFWIIEDFQGEKVGYFATFDCDARNGVFKYAVIILRLHWGKGYARDAIRVVFRYYFRELRYQKVVALVYSFNERSIRLHQGLGFQLEGRARRMVYTNGKFYDELTFGLTCEEFDQVDPPSCLDDIPGESHD